MTIVELHIDGKMKYRATVIGNNNHKGSTEAEKLHHQLTRFKRIGEGQPFKWELFYYKKSRMNSWGKPKKEFKKEVKRIEGTYSNPDHITEALKRAV